MTLVESEFHFFILFMQNYAQVLISFNIYVGLLFSCLLCLFYYIGIIQHIFQWSFQALVWAVCLKLFYVYKLIAQRSVTHEMSIPRQTADGFYLLVMHIIYFFVFGDLSPLKVYQIIVPIDLVFHLTISIHIIKFLQQTPLSPYWYSLLLIWILSINSFIVFLQANYTNIP